MVERIRGVGFAFVGLALLYMGIVDGFIRRRMPLSGRFGDGILEGNSALMLGLVFVALAPFALGYAYKKLVR